MRPNVSFNLDTLNTRVVLNGDVRRVKKRIISQKLFNSEAKTNTIHISERERKERRLYLLEEE